jgi:hypothetical protein
MEVNAKLDTLCERLPIDLLGLENFIGDPEHPAHRECVRYWGKVIGKTLPQDPPPSTLREIRSSYFLTNKAIGLEKDEPISRVALLAAALCLHVSQHLCAFHHPDNTFCISYGFNELIDSRIDRMIRLQNHISAYDERFRTFDWQSHRLRLQDGRLVFAVQTSMLRKFSEYVEKWIEHKAVEPRNLAAAEILDRSLQDHQTAVAVFGYYHLLPRLRDRRLISTQAALNARGISTITLLPQDLTYRAEKALSLQP